LVQVAGRAGREKQRGEVFVQSLFPEHESLQLAVKQDYDDFAESELKHRAALCYPPYYRVAQLRFVSHRDQILKDFFSRWQIFLEKTRENFLKKKILLMGPTEMAIYKLRGRYRYHILLKIPRELKSAEVAWYLVDHFEKQKPKGIECLVDIDPIHLV
jgi:primosomal protein N' (replication factor Y)